MKKLLVAVLLIGASSVAVYIAGREHKSITFHEGSSPKYTLSSKEEVILNMLLAEDAMAFSEGKNSLLKLEVGLSTSAAKVAEEYNENQVAADQHYYDKILFLSGRIEGINSGIGNEPYLLLFGINSFLSPQAHFNDGNTEKIATLRKYQNIYLVCRGDGAIAGTPMFKNCQFASDYVKGRISRLKIEISDFLDGKKLYSKSAYIITVMSITISRMLPDNSACFTGTQTKCLSEIHSINTSERAQKNVFQVIRELKEFGIQVPSEKLSSSSNLPWAI